MKIHIDGKDYILTQEVEDRLLGQFYQMFVNLYSSPLVPAPLRLAIKPLARNELQKKEKELNHQGLDGRAVRPPQGTDPALWFLQLEMNKFRGEGKLRDVTLYIDTETDSSTISAFSLSVSDQSQGGGSDTPGGYLG
jgi:hypothetical protein